ncbi:hypothetical protein [Flavobacterium branchiophilum]|uniref:Uncharacterized protein n=1 Tax=Flavobacterium branchiophilum TaxID=55197 RepID=A0A2H3KDJ7_9FLAO|nr:hypothetical protein [Flavobacterium branchiophilum]PDS24661.1 hypothetical protein B0A77_07280 [Flavobacterium branchiophilum]
MILPFSAKINGKPSYFPEKILMGLLVKKLTPEPDFNSICPRGVIIPKGDIMYNIHFDHTINHKPKYHTIREDKNDRWKVGTKIDFFINVRQKNMYRFAPVLPVVGVQEVFMTYAFNDVIEISVDEKYITDVVGFAKNDGFDKWEDFFNFFYPKIMENPEQFYKAKIIHWTDFKY